ncbi:MAG: hypothetical protein ACXV9P_00300 [Acidimicrobiia bacterium]
MAALWRRPCTPIRGTRQAQQVAQVAEACRHPVRPQAAPTLGRLDDIGEVLAAAAATCVAAVDEAFAPGAGVPSYAQGRIVGPYLRAVEGLAQHVRPSETDAWSRFLDDPEWRDYLAAADDPTAALRAMADDPDEPEAATARVLADCRRGDPFPLVDPDA